MSEEWRVVKGWPHYEVSNAGAVRASDGRLLRQRLSTNGYPTIRVSRPRGQLLVHRVVAEAFVPNPKGAATVNHLNNKRSDNRAENLEWCSQAENLAHADRQGRLQHNYWLGKRSPQAKLTDQQAREIRQHPQPEKEQL